MDNNMDKILRQALSSEAEVPEHLNDKILTIAKEKKYMSLRKKRIITVAAAAVIACSATAIAAIKYLSPKDVAKRMDNTALAEAFESDGAVLVNETQEAGGYKATFLGIVSGEGISDYVTINNGTVLNDRTYAVTAIEKSDGTPMPDMDSEQSFFVSPLIEGLNPVQFNAFTLNGGYSEFVMDGVLYRLMECSNVEAFADRTVYLCVSDSMAYNIAAYSFDEATGEITRNADYDGLNALFIMPLDASKADSAAAESIISEINDFWNGDDADDTELA
ncbi:MAG: hypothetical protein LUE88_04935 [Clostridiales bacterium]|nr:hypothetical protein [Clostridiales bacterium]